MSEGFVLQELKRVAFFGDAGVRPESEVYQEAWKGARLLAERGYEIVNGGGPGVMEAATKGAKSVGGKVTTVLFEDETADGFEGGSRDNVGDVVVKYNNYPDRLKELLIRADVYLVFKGGTGTLSELGMVWVMAKLYRGRHKPFILVGEFWREVIGAVERNLFIDDMEKGLVEIVGRVEEAVAKVEEMRKRLVTSDE